MSTTSALVLEERHGHTVLFTLNRPDRHHALSRALCGELVAAIRRAEGDPEVRVLVLTGNGEKAFCAGADMLELSGLEEGAGAIGSPDQVINAVSQTPLPIIAAINGYCYGGGAAMAVGCDIRLAAGHATFRLPGSEYGLVVAAASLARLVGAAKAKELIFTARRFDAAEAAACGLVSAVYPATELLPAALAMAASIGSHSAAAVQAAKRVIDAATLSPSAFALEREVNRTLRGSPEQVSRFRSATQRVTGQ